MTTTILINVALAAAILAIVLSVKAWAIRTQHHDSIHFTASVDRPTPAPADAISVAEPEHSDTRTPARRPRSVHGQRGISRGPVGAED